MRKEQKEIERLGPIGIIRESFKLFWTYSKFSTMVQLTLLLPLAAVSTLGSEYVIYRNSGEQRFPVTGTSGMPQLPGLPGSDSVPAAAPWLHLGVFMIGFLLIGAVVSMLGVAVLSLSSSAIIYAVGLHYTGQSVSFKDVVRAAIPRLWMRLTVTRIYKVFLFYSLLIGQIIVSLLLVQYHMAVPLLLLGVAMFGLVSIVGGVCLELVFVLASAVSVLEKDYGWAALTRAPKLLKGRLMVALLFQLLLLVPTVLILGLQRVFRTQIMQGNLSPWSVLAFVISTAMYISISSFVWQLQALSTGVQYAAFKAYHNEDLAESMFEKQETKVVYERIEFVADDEKLGGQKADSFV